MEEKDIFNQKLIVEQKMFYFDLKTTPRGEYLKITEKRNGMRNTIKIPVSGLTDFKDILEEVIKFNATFSNKRDEES